MSPIRIVFIALCCVGLYLIVRALWPGGEQGPDGDVNGPSPTMAQEPSPESPDSPNRRRFEGLLDELVSDPGRFLDVRDKLNAILREDLDPRLAEQVRDAMSKLAQQWLFGAQCVPGDRLCGFYEIHHNDLLSTVGQANLVPWELLARINRISNPRSLKLGQAIKVVHGPFNAVVSLSDFRMDLYLQDMYVQSFPVGLARPGKVTPVGTWLVKDRIRDAAWTDPDTGETLKPGDPNYPLGPVWMPLEGVSGEALGQPSYGIHGTNDPESIGTASSRGCVRLRNSDAEAVFDLLMPGYSKVIIIRGSKYR